VKAQLLIPAAGMGLRLGRAAPKALVDLEGVPLLVRALERFASLDLIGDALVVVPPGQEDVFRLLLDDTFPDSAITLVPGGEERQHSVENGLDALAPDTEIVVIHDAARPFVPEQAVQASIDAAAADGAATVAIPCVDTILVSDGDQYLEETPDRTVLWACQTPQTFRVEVIRKAHAQAREKGLAATDDATVVRLCGGRPKLVMGSPLNFKVTTPEDFALAQVVIRENLV
jgi:2-C-methyl-D-erythritol 4-phosphate cytidylyltransferase